MISCLDYRLLACQYDYNKLDSVTLTSIYDMASVTKICATTLAIMKLYDEGKIDFKKKLGDYLPWVKGSGKENLFIEGSVTNRKFDVPSNTSQSTSTTIVAFGIRWNMHQRVFEF